MPAGRPGLSFLAWPESMPEDPTPLGERWEPHGLGRVAALRVWTHSGGCVAASPTLGSSFFMGMEAGGSVGGRIENGGALGPDEGRGTAPLQN